MGWLHTAASLALPMIYMVDARTIALRAGLAGVGLIVGGLALSGLIGAVLVRRMNECFERNGIR